MDQVIYGGNGSESLPRLSFAVVTMEKFESLVMVLTRTIRT